MNIKVKKGMSRLFLLWIPLLLFIAFISIPLLWALSVSLKNGSDVVNGIFTILPDPVTFGNYIYVWTKNNISVYFGNSMLISSVSIIVIVICAVLNGYALSRFQFRGKNVFIVLLLMTQMVPIMINLPAIYILVRTLHLADSRIAIILLNIAGSIPYNTLLMKGFIGGVPKEIDEAARIDGCNRAQVIYKIVLPVVVPGIVTVAAFAFISCWNEYLLSYSLLNTSSKFPISVGLKYLIGEYSVNYSALAAGSIIALLPPLLLFGYVQRYLISGMSVGAVKG